MMTKDNYVLCFDIRVQIEVLNHKPSSEVSTEYSHRWSEDRKQHFLFRLDVETPISVDRNVTEIIDEPHYDANSIGYTGPLSPYWESLDALRLFIKSSKLNANAYFLLSITLNNALLTDTELSFWNALLDNKSQALQKTELFEGLATPNRLDENWEFIGYDVADTGFTSALSNMGFSDGENPSELRTEWSDALNRHHLFDHSDAALRFKAFSDQRVPEHAPFFVFGLWRVKDD
ncbi:MAG: hypothetical protein COB30_001575 [Ectothiorhodospiraceae bacterium]|nr:hypothetical protein [Ectothiorhodospiraceae bacterium]